MPLTKPSASRPMEIAAIDLGSNGFHMIVARIVNGALQILTRIKKRVHLADGLDEHNQLNEESIQRALTCLALLLNVYKVLAQIMSVLLARMPYEKQLTSKRFTTR